MPNTSTIKKHTLYIALSLVSIFFILIFIYSAAQTLHLAQAEKGIIQSYPHVEFDEKLYRKTHPGRFHIKIDLPDGLLRSDPEKMRINLLYVTLLAMIVVCFIIRLLFLVYALIRKRNRQQRLIQTIFAALAYPSILTLLIVTGINENSSVVNTVFGFCLVLLPLYTSYLMVMRHISKNDSNAKKIAQKLIVVSYILAGLGVLWLGILFIQQITKVCLGIYCSLFWD